MVSSIGFPHFLQYKAEDCALHFGCCALMNIKYPGRCLHMLSCFKNGSFQKRGYSPCVHVGPHPQTSPVKGRGTARRRWRGKVGRLRAIEKSIKPGGEPLRPSVAPVPLYLTRFVWTDYTILFYACLPFFASSQRPHRIRRQRMKGRLFAASPCRILLINIRVIFFKTCYRKSESI